jgi:ATP-binding cassette, subfamily C, bacteriocin exporter
VQKNVTVKQTGFEDCAVACMKSIIKYYGGNISLDELKSITYMSENGTSAFHILKVMRNLGFDGYGVKISLKKLIKENITLPAVAHVKNGIYYHFVVIYEINLKKKYFKIMDPDKGMINVSFEKFENIFLGTILILWQVSKIPDVKVNESAFSLMINYLIINKSNIFKIIVISIFSSILTFIINFYYKILIDYIVVKNSYKIFLIIFIIFVIFSFFKEFYLFIRNKLIIEIQMMLKKNVTLSNVKHILNFPYHYFNTKPTSEILSKLNDLESIENFISKFILFISNDLFMILIYIIVLLIINRSLFIFTILIILLYVLISIIFYKIYKKKLYNYRESHSSYYLSVNESFKAYESIKNLNILNKIFKYIDDKYINNITDFKKYLKVNNIESFIKSFIYNLVSIILLSILGLFYMKNIISMGDILLYYFCFNILLSSIQSLLELIHEYNVLNSAFTRVNELISIKEDKYDYNNQKMLQGSIIISNLSFSYDQVNNIFTNLSLSIKNKEKVFIYSESGFGKSTLCKIILKYLNYEKGKIIIGDRNLKDISKEEIINSSIYVSQNEKLFSDTLKNNIICFRNVNSKKYEEILKITHVDKIREKSKFRDNALIKEDGFNYSGGERQKIILARALLKKCNYIILDEALSEISVSEEKEIINNIVKYFSDKTIIYISHKKELSNLFFKSYNLKERRKKVC